MGVTPSERHLHYAYSVFHNLHMQTLSSMLSEYVSRISHFYYIVHIILGTIGSKTSGSNLEQQLTHFITAKVDRHSDPYS